MIEIGTYARRQAAELAQAILAAGGIPSVVEADDVAGAYPVALSGQLHLLVGQANADQVEPNPCSPDSGSSRKGAMTSTGKTTTTAQLMRGVMGD
jgi:hypothetical protein